MNQNRHYTDFNLFIDYQCISYYIIVDKNEKNQYSSSKPPQKYYQYTEFKQAKHNKV